MLVAGDCALSASLWQGTRPVGLGLVVPCPGSRVQGTGRAAWESPVYSGLCSHTWPSFLFTWLVSGQERLIWVPGLLPEKPGDSQRLSCGAAGGAS